MQMHNTQFSSFVKIIIVLMLFAPSLAAQSNTLKILQVRTFTDKNLAGLEIVFAPFFTEKVTGTIQSGLPSMLEIEFVIKNKKRKTLFRKVVFRRISYNIWEEKYRIDGADSSQFFKEFSDLQKACILLKTKPILPRKILLKEHASVAMISAQLRLISSSQSRKLAGWLDRSEQTIETISSDEQSSGFRLNFSALVSMFMGNSPKHNNRNRWQEFPLNFPENE